MAVLVIGTIGDKPPAFGEVSARLEAGGQPEGLILQMAGAHDGSFKTFSVWETREQHDDFLENRLRPAIKEAVGDEAYAAMPEVPREYVELEQIIKP